MRLLDSRHFFAAVLIASGLNVRAYLFPDQDDRRRGAIEGMFRPAAEAGQSLAQRA